MSARAACVVALLSVLPGSARAQTQGAGPNRARSVDLAIDVSPTHTAANLQTGLHALLAAHGITVQLMAADTRCPSQALQRALACLRIDQLTTHELRVEVYDSAQSQRLERWLSLPAHPSDAIVLEEVSQIVESALPTWLSDTAAPASSEASAQLGPTPPALQPTAARQRGDSERSDGTAIVAEPSCPSDTFAIDAGYEIAAWTNRAWIGGPRLSLHWSRSALGVRLGAAVSLWTGLPVETVRWVGATSELWPSTGRVTGVLQLPLADALSLLASVGVAIQFLKASSQPDPATNSSLQAQSPIMSMAVSLHAGLALHAQLFGPLALALGPNLEIAPSKLGLVVGSGRGNLGVIEVRALRPAVALWLALTL